MRLWLTFVTVLLLKAGYALGSEGPVNLSAPEKGQLLAFSGAARNTSLDALPAGIAKQCADSGGKLGAPSDKWEPTDVIRDPTLPRSRLIWHATSGRQTLVHYETGGRGHSYWLLIADRQTANVLLRTYSGAPLKGPPDLKEFIEKSAVLSGRP